MKVLVTGAAGFVGSRLCEVLLEGGHRVRGLDVFDQKDINNWQEARLQLARENPKFDLIVGDVREEPLVNSVIREFRPDAVVHLASRKNLEWSEENPSACLDLHVGGAVKIMDCCTRLNVPMLVVGSSSHVYGGSKTFPFLETDSAVLPLSVLGAALRASELLLYARSLQSPVNTSIVRIFSVYGPRQSPERLIPQLMQAVSLHKPTLIVGDGTSGRDLLYIDDLVVGLLRVLDRPAPFQIVNLGSGETSTLAQVAELVSWLFDVQYQKVSLPLRSGEMPNTFADIRLARERFGFNPTVGLETGIRKTKQWFVNHL